MDCFVSVVLTFAILFVTLCSHGDACKNVESSGMERVVW